MRAFPLLIALASCDPGGTVEVVQPSEYIYEAEEPDIQPLDVDELTTAINDALDLIPSLSADPVLAAYDEVMQYQDSYCPAYYTTEDGTYWYDNCSAAGSSYAGYAFTEDFEDYVDEYGNISSGRTLAGGASITTPDGDVFNASGAAAVYTTEVPTDNLLATTIVLNGTFEWTGDSGAGTWLQTGSKPDLEMAAYLTEPTPPYTEGGRGLYVAGAITDVSGAGSVVSFTDFWLANAMLGAPCSDEPVGTLSVRSPEGAWYDVVFDGAYEGETVDAQDCDGCGEAYFRGEKLGKVCVDFDRALDWEVSPW